MYLTAQRVRAPRGATGINVALYMHGVGTPPAVWFQTPEEVLAFAKLPEHRTALAIHYALPPGGNRVESDLDVAGPDGSDLATLEGALRSARQTGIKNVLVHRVGPVSISFHTYIAANSQPLFDELGAAILAALAQPQPPAWLTLEPLQVLVERQVDGWRFVLDARSATAVTQAGGIPLTIQIKDTVARQLRALHGGHLYPQVARWVTCLDTPQLLNLGGVQFLDVQRNRQIVGEWPVRH